MVVVRRRRRLREVHSIKKGVVPNERGEGRGFFLFVVVLERGLGGLCVRMCLDIGYVYDIFLRLYEL